MTINSHKLITISFAAIVLVSSHTSADSNTSPELESISPSSESVTVGMAGENPADIARHLLASGAKYSAISPDGKNIAFIYLITGKPQLWIMPTNGGQAQQITFGNGVTFFEWTPSSQHLLYGADNNGNEQESYFLIASDGSSERELISAATNGFRVFGGFSGNGSQFSYASTERNGLDFDIYIADTKTANSKLVYQGKYGFFVTAVSPDGQHLVLSETVGEDSDNLYLLDTKSGERETISVPSPRANHTRGNVAWQANNKALYFATNKNHEYTALVRYDLADKTLSTVFEANADVQNVQLCGENDRYLAWTTNHNGFDRLHALDRTNNQQISAPTIAEGNYQLSCSKSNADVVIKVNGWKTPGDIVVWNIADKSTKTVFKSNLAGLDPVNIVRPESIFITARDGVKLQGLLYLPKTKIGSNKKRPPLVFEVHGGPAAQSRPTFNAPIQYLIGQGIAVFQPNVRGSTGFGRTYATLDDRKKRLDSVRDLIDMLKYLDSTGKADVSRAAVSGGSYGGYMVNAVLASYPSYFKAGVSRFGVADWVTALEVASPALKASDRIEYGDISEQKWRDFYSVNSPINQADKINVPILYSHGVMDPRIDIAETETMVRALRKNEIEAPFIRIPDEGHGWRKLSNQLFYFRRQAEFLEKHLLNEN